MLFQNDGVNLIYNIKFPDFTLDSEYIFLKNKCSALATCSTQPLSALALRGKSHMAHVGSLVTEYFLLHAAFLKQSSSKNFGFIILLNQSLKESMVNFNSIEKSSIKQEMCIFV